MPSQTPARGPGFLDVLTADARFALRYFARHKATTAIIVTVLALGTGANTLIFSLFQAQFIRPAPAVPVDPAHSRIWAQQRATPTGTWEPRYFTGPELTALAEHRESFESVAAWVEDDVILGAGDSTGARRVGAQFVTSNYLTTLGVAPVAGRGLQSANGSTADLSAVISHLAAKDLFGSAENAVGKQVLVNDDRVLVVGVAPERFQGALRGMDEPALWLPLSARSAITGVTYRWIEDEPALSLFARLAPGATRERATAVAQQLVASTLPDSADRVGMARTADVIELGDVPPGPDHFEVLIAFTVMMVLGALILVVAWMNVSSLMVAAAVARRHEIAVRLSLGASRFRLVRQLVTESTLLALAGGMAGLTMAYWVLTWMTKTEIDAVDISPDLGTFAFVLAIAVGSGILFGLSPALHATSGGVANALRDSGGGSSGRNRLQRGLVVAQIALSQPLLVLLGTMISLVISDYHPLPRAMSSQVIEARFRPLEHATSAELGPEAVEALIPRFAERAQVKSVVPAPAGSELRGVFAADAPSGHVAGQVDPTIVSIEGAAPGWFEALDVPILLGRDISLADTASSDRPVVIGADLARALWGDANPVGRMLHSPAIPGLNKDTIVMTVVGVYDATARVPGMMWEGSTSRGTVRPRLYTAYGKHWERDRVLIRTRGPAAPHLADLQRLAIAEAPSLPLASMRTLQQIDEESYRSTIQVSALASAGGLLALVLASLGLYGVIALAVRQRMREIGVRIAVGAHPMRVARMFLASGVKSSLLALAIGLPVSVAALRLGMSSGVFIAPGTHPVLIGAVIAVILVAVAAAATWIPARRAAEVDPAVTLRAE